MALSTGTQSLRGVGPRAPQFNPRDFAIDVESLGRAATMPGRVAEQIEDFGERRAERRIRDETRPARREVALATTGGAAQRAPLEQEVLTEQARGAAGRVVDQEEILTAQTRGARSRVGAEQELLGRGVQRATEDFDPETDRIRSQRQSEIATARRAAEEEAQRLAILESTEAENLFAGRQAAEDRIVEQQVRGMEAGRRRAQLEGTPETRLIENEEGQFAEEFITSPTGERRVVGRQQTKTAQQVQLERDQIELSRRAAEALAAQREAAAARTGNRVAVRERTGKLGETLGFTLITTAEDGRVIGTEEIAVGETQPSATAPGVSEMQGSLPSRESAQVPVRENGREFVPSGQNVGGYRRGIIYTHPTEGRVLYTGGDPFDPNNFQPVQ